MHVKCEVNLKSMKRIFVIISIILGAIAIMVVIGIYKFNFANNDIYIQTDGELNSKDATYLINEQAITLKNGISQIATVAGSASETTTRYFGNEVAGDLNGDGQSDVAFLLTQDHGGSGTFYYIAVALASNQGYGGLNAILLGDRIAPQTTEISEGRVIVNYADRKEGDSMSTAPSVGVSKYFQVVNQELREVDSSILVVNPVSTSSHIYTDETDAGSQVIRKQGETCGENIGNCAIGLKCAYPCGIPGCENVCLPENELPRP